jgi:predicted nucleic acid-binding protein
MPGMVMLDANIYTNQTYKGPASRIPTLCVSSVVVQELMVIAAKEQREALIRGFREKLKSKEGVVPDAEDWLEVGKCLARLFSGESGIGKLSKEEVSTLVKDALIARTAIRMEATLITSNTNDFAKIKSVFKSLVFKSPSEFFGTRQR